MEHLRISYTEDNERQKDLAHRIQDLARGLGHICFLSPTWLDEAYGDVTTMDLSINGTEVLIGEREVRDALESGELERELKSVTQ